jgi:hypothetical protein
MASMRPKGVAVAVLAVSMVLAGCTPTADSAVPTATPTVAPTPTPSPTVEPTRPPVPSKPRVSDLVLTPDGLGPLALGVAPPETTPALDVLVWDADRCAAEGGQWVPNYAEPFPFEVGVRDGVVSRIDVWMGPIATDTGVRRGSSLAALLEAYPDGFTAVNEAGHTSDVYIVNGRVGQLLIEVATDDRFPGYWEPADIDRVMFVRSILLTDAPSPISGSDNVVGGCGTAP